MKNLVLVLFCLAFSVACNLNEKQAASNLSTDQNASKAGAAPPPDNSQPNPAKAVKVRLAKPIEVAAGSTTEAEFNLEIQEPFHVNSNPPSEKSFIPLEIALENVQGITAGKPLYPKGELKKFAFSEDKPISVYTGEITVKIPFKTDNTVVAGEQEIKGKLKFQPCDEEVCYRPQTIDVAFPATIN